MPSLNQLISRLFAPRDLPLRIYGKVPFAPEYRRLNTAGPVAAAFCRWIDDGRAAWMQHSPDASITPTGLLLKPTERPEFVVAQIRDSQDSVGRSFPIAFFVTASPRALGNDPWRRWHAVERLWSQLRAHLEADLPPISSPEEFQAAFRNRRLSPAVDSADLSPATRDLARLTVAECLRLLDYATEEDKRAACAALLRRAAGWGPKSETVRRLAAACPLDTHGMLAAIWATWLLQLTSAAGCSLQCVVPAQDALASGRANGMWCFSRELLASDFQLLTRQAGVYGLVEPLLGRPPSRGAPDGPDLPPDDELMLSWLTRAAQR